MEARGLVGRGATGTTSRNHSPKSYLVLGIWGKLSTPDGVCLAPDGYYYMHRHGSVNSKARLAFVRRTWAKGAGGWVT